MSLPNKSQVDAANDYVPKVTEPTEEEKVSLKKIGSVVGAQVATVLIPAINILISKMRTELIQVQKKQVESLKIKKEIFSKSEDLRRVTSYASSTSSFFDRIPIEVIKGIPVIYEQLQKVRESSRSASSRMRNLDYQITQLNNRELAQDFAIQQMDSGIKKLKGVLEYLNSELQKGTI